MEKNIFVRNRPATRANRRPDNDRRRPEELLVLTGIALQEGRHVAFIENRATGVTQRLLPGASVLTGKVAAVGFDSLEFETDGRRIKVEIGRTFAGNVFAAPAPTSSPSASPTTATASPSNPNAAPAPPPLVDDPNLSKEEQMRRRRQQLTR